jgi:hypothetical protein
MNRPSEDFQVIREGELLLEFRKLYPDAPLSVAADKLEEFRRAGVVPVKNGNGDHGILPELR